MRADKVGSWMLARYLRQLLSVELGRGFLQGCVADRPAKISPIRPGCQGQVSSGSKYLWNSYRSGHLEPTLGAHVVMPGASNRKTLKADRQGFLGCLTTLLEAATARFEASTFSPLFF